MCELAQDVLLKILIDIKQCCDENNIDYMVGGGTLLGTIRHNGFIPWDDDIDIMMTRENYEKFSEVFLKFLGDKYILAEPLDKQYFSKMPKVYYYIKGDYMNIAIILSGGAGTRLGYAIPKQYIEVGEKAIIQYCLNTFQNNLVVDGIIIVAAQEWQDTIYKWIEEDKISKFFAFADAGSSRQHSIFNALNIINNLKEKSDIKIIIHDAARPNLSNKLICQCFEELNNADGVMPVLSVKDTIYFSEDGKSIAALMNRDKLFAGQAPESFCFEKYYRLHMGLTELELANIRGSSEIAYKNELKIKLIPGDECNYKITTEEDLAKFRLEQEILK